MFMVQKIGKLLLTTLFLFSVLVADSQISLRVLDMNGEQLADLGIGIPFLIDVEISGEGAGVSEPDLKTHPVIALVPGGTSSSVRTINGHTTVKKKYRYQATVDHEGKYLIGPAYIERDGKQVASNSIELQASVQQKKVEQGHHEKAFVEISASKNTVYWAEPFTFILRFYHLDGVRLDSITQPVFQGLKASELKGPISGSEVKDGIMYNYLEWKALVYPEESGRITIPAVGAYIIMQATARSSQFDVFSMMDHMLGGGSERKTIYSNALIVNVKQLPEYQDKVSAVGIFTSLSAKANLDQAVQGEGIVYTLELVGTGNFSMIGHPKIVVPEGLKYYESNTKLHALGANMYKKDFEYVVQAIEPGSYTIAPQEMVYFDLKNSTYKVLKTKSIPLTITAGKQEIAKEVIDSDDSDASESDIFLLEQRTKWRAIPGRFIPWKLFFLFVLIPIVLFFIKNSWKFWREYQERNTMHFSYKNAFKNIRSRLKEYGKHPKPVDLYHVTLDFFAARLKIPKSEISDALIERALQQGGMSAESIAAWNQFFSHITESAFTFDQSSDTAHMATVLLEWISKFERIL